MAFQLIFSNGSLEDRLEKVNWKSVLVSGFLGAVSGGVAGGLGAAGKRGFIILAADALADVGLGTLADIRFFGKDPWAALGANALGFGLATGLGYAFGKVIGGLNLGLHKSPDLPDGSPPKSSDLPDGSPSRPHDAPEVPGDPGAPHRGDGGDAEPPRGWDEPDDPAHPGRDTEPGGDGDGEPQVRNPGPDEPSVDDPGSSLRKPRRWYGGDGDPSSTTWTSPAGLVYGTDKKYGTRVNHVLNHADDIPTRPGSHGVFDGGSDSVLAVIDEAYILAQTPGPHVSVRVEGAFTVYEVKMGRRIGFVGGEEGAKLGNPGVTRIRLVLEENEVITAYPIQ